jgi:protein TonB
MAAATVGGIGGSGKGLVIFVGAVVLGALIAVTMFALMRYLILTDARPVDEAREAPNIEITSDRRDSEVITRQDRPDEPDDVKAPPPPPRIEAAKAEQPQEGLAAALGALPDINPDAVQGENISFVVADRDEQPLVRMEPNYPMRAAERGLEGTCDMTFDVLPDGTIDASTIDADCTSSLFARDASRAVARWKYNPKIVNGEAVVRRGVRTTLDFRLADE